MVPMLSNRLHVGNLVEMISGKYQRELGSVVHQDKGLVLIRSANNSNLRVCLALSTQFPWLH